MKVDWIDNRSFLVSLRVKIDFIFYLYFEDLKLLGALMVDLAEKCCDSNDRVGLISFFLDYSSELKKFLLFLLLFQGLECFREDSLFIGYLS